MICNENIPELKILSHEYYLDILKENAYYTIVVHISVIALPSPEVYLFFTSMFITISFLMKIFYDIPT